MSSGKHLAAIATREVIKRSANTAKSNLRFVSEKVRLQLQSDYSQIRQGKRSDRNFVG